MRRSNNVPAAVMSKASCLYSVSVFAALRLLWYSLYVV